MNTSHSSPIIIRRRVKSGDGGHHGGAWKVAYADFVTAMMAFFLLMWLLNATTEEQRKGLADYFNPSIPISKVSGGGQGALNGSSVLSEDSLIRDNIGGSTEFPSTKRELQSDMGAQSDQLDKLREKIEASKDDNETKIISKHIKMRIVDAGLLIELIDVDDEPLFSVGSAKPSKILDELLFVVAPVLATVENKIAITGHTDALTYASKKNYSNWELSTDRANASRRLLIDYGFPIYQVAQVSGKASTEPISTNPAAAQNRRIAITILRNG